MHMGRRVEQVLRIQGRTARWLAEQLPCDRTNVYNIFKRPVMDTELLQRISKILDYDFFQELSKETFSE